MLTRRMLLQTLAVTAMLAAGSSTAMAQGTSFSPSLSTGISDPLTSSSATAGFDSTFDSSTANLTNPSTRADVNDPTHSQLLGSALTPFDNSYINPQVQTTPLTGIVADSRSIVGYNEFSFGGRRSRSFFPSSGTDAVTAKQAAAYTLGSASMQGAFSGMLGSRAAFSHQAITNSGTSRGFSGEGNDATRPQLGLGAQALEDSSGLPEDSTAFYASDPVLTGSGLGGEAGPEIHGDLPSPLEQAAGFFADPKTVGFDYQYDDGQTPPLHVTPVPGTIFPSPEYYTAAGGFPDSTKGLAGSLPQQPPPTRFGSSAFGGDTSSSPFPAVSDGFAFSPKTRLNPDLHAITLPKVPISFETFERNAQRDRYRLGISISQAGDYYQQDLRNYRRSQIRRDHKSTLDGPNSNLGQQQEIVRRPAIR